MLPRCGWELLLLQSLALLKLLRRTLHPGCIGHVVHWRLLRLWRLV
ncbi:MAG: hypothetical protein GY772_21840 [bacterium]|nr:hypothetical protein [bacterium]